MVDDKIILDIKARNDLSDEDVVKVVFKFKNNTKNTWNIILVVNIPAYSNVIVNKKYFLIVMYVQYTMILIYLFALNIANTGISKKMQKYQYCYL